MSGNCNEIRIIISAGMDGEISPDERRMANNHLDTCTSCEEYRKFQVMLDLEVKQVPRFTPSEIDEMMEKILPRPKSGPSPSNLLGQWFSPVYAGIAGVLIILSLLIVTSRHQLTGVRAPRQEESVFESLPAEERAFLINMDDRNFDKSSDLLEMFQDLDDLEELFDEGKATT